MLRNWNLWNWVSQHLLKYVLINDNLHTYNSKYVLSPNPPLAYNTKCSSKDSKDTTEMCMKIIMLNESLSKEVLGKHKNLTHAWREKGPSKQSTYVNIVYLCTIQHDVLAKWRLLRGKTQEWIYIVNTSNIRCATQWNVPSVSLSVRTHETTTEPLNGLLRNLILESFVTIRPKIPISVKNWQKGAIYREIQSVPVFISDAAF
jgi:hypothetical protein